MIEEFDAARQANMLGAFGLLLALIALGAAIELGPLRWARRRASAGSDLLGAVVLTALSGQALLWGVVVGLRLTVGDLLPKQSDQIRSALLFAMVLASVIVVVRLGTNWVRRSFALRQIGSVSLINNLLRFIGGIVITATVLSFYGVPVGALLTVVAGSSVGLTLALRDPLANLFSGMVVIASSKIRPGDYVRLSSGEEGYVTDIRWSDTYIRQLSNNLIVVPNSLMTSTIVVNYSRPESEQAVTFSLRVSYASDLEQVERVATEVAAEVMEEVAGGVPEFVPLIRFGALGDSSVDLTVIMRGRTFIDQFLIKHEFVKRLRARFRAEGIEPPFPIQTLQTNGPIPVRIQPADAVASPPSPAAAGEGDRG
ncbi:MAG: mechanosensitive ion channel family protein [Chloroflexales bacterium]